MEWWPNHGGRAPRGPIKISRHLGTRCGIFAVLIDFIENLFWLLHVPDSAWIILTVTGLFVATGMAVIGGGRWRWPWIIVLLAFAAGICLAKQPISAGLHWLGLALLILAVGPVIVNPVAVEIRAAAWRFSINGMVVLTGVFILWYLLRFTELWRRGFFELHKPMHVRRANCWDGNMHCVVARYSWSLLAVGAAGHSRHCSAVGFWLPRGNPRHRRAGCFLLIRRKPVLGGLWQFFFCWRFAVSLSMGERAEQPIKRFAHWRSGPQGNA